MDTSTRASYTVFGWVYRTIRALTGEFMADPETGKRQLDRLGASTLNPKPLHEPLNGFGEPCISL